MLIEGFEEIYRLRRGCLKDGVRIHGTRCYRVSRAFARVFIRFCCLWGLAGFYGDEALGLWFRALGFRVRVFEQGGGVRA